MAKDNRIYNQTYTGKNLDYIAFPLGGMGSGMICLDGRGSLSHVSIQNHPDIFNEPLIFSALCVKAESNVPRVLAGPVPKWKIFGRPGGGEGVGGKNYGMPHCKGAEFTARFPFAAVKLQDDKIPLDMEVTGWSPFIPNDADNSSIPVAALEYKFTNHSDSIVEAVYSFHSINFLSNDAFTLQTRQATRPVTGGFIIYENGTETQPWKEASFGAAVDDPEVKVNCAWFRGAHHLKGVWDSIAHGTTPQSAPVSQGGPSSGASLYVPLRLSVGQEKTIRLRLFWYVPNTNLSIPDEHPDKYMPWYAGRFKNVDEVNEYWQDNYDSLRQKSKLFSDCFYDTTLPAEVTEAIAANLTILKSPTVLRQIDGRIWMWEGSEDSKGSCHGSCTHVWGYAQALCHLFPSLERGLRETELFEDQDERGHQFSHTLLPIRPNSTPKFLDVVDGQLGGIMRVYREWRISGDTDWLKRLWPRVKQGMDYCIDTWGSRHCGILEGPQPTTYDNVFWGPNGMCTSIYLGALQAAIVMGEAMEDDTHVYQQLLEKGCEYMEAKLFDGEYFIQKIEWKGLDPDPVKHAKGSGNEYRREGLELLEKEGPIYQYGKGCFADGIVGSWMGAVCGVPAFIDHKKIESHLISVYRNNFYRNLSKHVNLARAGMGFDDEAGVVLCTWSKGGELTQPFNYNDEIWTGVEHQVAGHLIMYGHVEEGLEIVRAVRNRYDGRVRNPFDEYEAGHWYGRAMSSYGLLQALTGIRYDAVEKVLYINPQIEGDFRSFLAAATGFGTVGIKEGQVFVDIKQGQIDIERIDRAE